MSTYETDALRHLARRLALSPSEQPDVIRRSLEDSLAPLVRAVLRLGIGQPALVAWVRRQVPPNYRDLEVSSLARTLSHRLAGVLLDLVRPALSGAETVVGV